MLEIKKDNSFEKIYNIRGPESIARNNGTANITGVGLPIWPSFAYGVIGDSVVSGDLDKPVKLVCGNNSAILKVSNHLFYNEVKVNTTNIRGTTDSEKRNFGRALCYFIEAYMPRVDNLSTGAGRAGGTAASLIGIMIREFGIAFVFGPGGSNIQDSNIAPFYKKHSTYIFWAIQAILNKASITDQQVLLGIWEYLLEYENHYKYDGTTDNVLDLENKAIYNGWFGADNQAQTILVPIFQKLAAALPEDIVKTFISEKQSMNSYALGQFLVIREKIKQPRKQNTTKTSPRSSPGINLDSVGLAIAFS